MLNLERIVLSDSRFFFSTLVRVPCLPLVYDSFSGDKNPFLNSASVNIEDERFQNSFSVQGGMLSDEMGLGKTISMISLLLSHPREPNEAGEFSRGRGAKGANIPTFVSKATLVVCPSQLVDQWKKEITSNSSMTCCTASTAAQHKKLSYQTLLDVDVVIISEKLLFSNVSYKHLVQSRERNVNSSRGTRHAVEVPTPQRNHVQPSLHEVDWHRIILDEGHEILAKNDMESFVSNFRWYVSGTPLPSGHKSFSHALNFLNFEIERETKSESQVAQVVETQVAKEHIFRRNMKEEVDREITIPPMVEKVISVSLTPIEQTIYDAAVFDRNPTNLRLILSDPKKQSQHIGSLDDPKLPAKYIAHYKAHMESIANSLKQSQKDLQEKRASLRLFPNDMTKNDIERLEKAIKRLEGVTIPSFERGIIEKVCQIACFTRLMEGDSSNETCEGCYQYSSGCLSLTCGHQLCSECLVKIQQNEGACVCCNSKVDIIGATLPPPATVNPEVSSSFSIGDANEDPWCSALRQIHGSKFAATALYLKEIMRAEADVKMIVFSQYESTLLALSSVLEEADPETFENNMVVCKGNVHARKNQLDRFRSTEKGSARVLLLSLKNSASGTHLAAATHVLLVDLSSGLLGKPEPRMLRPLPELIVWAKTMLSLPFGLLLNAPLTKRITKKRTAFSLIVALVPNRPEAPSPLFDRFQTFLFQITNQITFSFSFAPFSRF